MAKQERATTAETETEAFRCFVNVGKLLVASETKQLPLPEFQKFVDEATPIALGDTRRTLATLAQKLSVLRDWTTEHDLIQVAGLSGDEDAYTELLTWLIRAATHPQSALRRQRAFVSVVAQEPPEINEPLDDNAILTQVVTGDGRPDLIVLVGRECIVVEAKTGTGERGARGSDRWQTFAYPVAVQRMFDRLTSLPQIAFLTMDRQEAKNPAAKLVTWAQCAIAIAEAVRPEEVGEMLRGLFGTVISHFVLCGLSGEAAKLLHEVKGGKALSWSDSQIASRLLSIQELLQILGGVSDGQRKLL